MDVFRCEKSPYFTTHAIEIINVVLIYLFINYYLTSIHILWLLIITTVSCTYGNA